MEILEKNNIPCKLIVDSALGYSLEEADMILVGSEAVVENGGIINRVLLKLLSNILKIFNYL